MDDRIIATISASTDLAPADVKYEAQMMDISDKLFHTIEMEGIKVYLFGGTALNKGFFGERQRLSRDLDLEIEDTRSFRKSAQKFESCIIKMGYSNIRVLDKEKSYTIYVSAPSGGDELKIDLVPQRNPVKPQQITLHSILEYNGVPIKTVRALSYPFEYLLAYKLNALGRRMIYKDIYDSYTALQLSFDIRKLTRYSLLFGRKNQLFHEIISNIDNGGYDKKDELGYEKLVQGKYRVPLKDMLYDIKSRLTLYSK